MSEVLTTSLPKEALTSSLSPIKKALPYFLIAFNLLFLAYVLMVSCYNQLALGEFGYLWVMRNYGFSNPFTYWYFQWQGRFAPHVLLNIMFLFYEVTSGLLYPIFMSAVFIYAIYQILKFYFQLSKPAMLNYSIVLFSSLLLTTFEINTFFWMNASAMYFGGIAFALLGTVYILKNENTGLWRYVVIALCFLYTGSSSEHVGALACLIFLSIIAVIFFKLAYASSDFTSHIRNLVSPPLNKGLLIAFFFCAAAFVIMILAPGTKVRMSATQHPTDLLDLLRKSYDATVFVGYHILYKLPYFVIYIPLFLVLGSYLRIDKQQLRVRFAAMLVIAAIAMVAMIFISNLPVAYALGTVAPLRAYVYVNFFLVATIFALCVYAGSRYLQNSKWIDGLAVTSSAVLFMMVLYTFCAELPLLKKYSETSQQRIITLENHKQNNSTEPVYLQPLFNPQYNTITDLWRKLSHTDRLPSVITDMPVVVGEISEKSDWTNEQLKLGLDLKFDVFIIPKNDTTKTAQ